MSNLRHRIQCFIDSLYTTEELLKKLDEYQIKGCKFSACDSPLANLIFYEFLDEIESVEILANEALIGATNGERFLVRLYTHLLKFAFDFDANIYPKYEGEI